MGCRAAVFWSSAVAVMRLACLLSLFLSELVPLKTTSLFTVKISAQATDHSDAMHYLVT